MLRVLQVASPHMWETIRNNYESVVESTASQLQPCLEALAPSSYVVPNSPARGTKLGTEDVIRRYIEDCIWPVLS